MKKENFNYSFTTSKTPVEILAVLLNVRKWWSGLYEETITGKSKSIGDEFTFKAGGGAHYSKQKLVALVPGKRVAWLVTDSRLGSLKNTNEWVGTHIVFDMAPDDAQTRVTFTHEGLVPKIECYKGCAGAWTSYLDNLSMALDGH